MPDRRDAAAVLLDWREVRRDVAAEQRDPQLTDMLDDAELFRAEAQRLRAEGHRLREEGQRLRDEYQRLVAEAFRPARPVPSSSSSDDGA